MSEAAACVVRVLWPIGLLEWLHEQDIHCCQLVGAILHCNSAQCESMVVAAIAGALKSENQAVDVHQTSNCCGQLLDSRNNATRAQVVVLGTWVSSLAALPSIHNQLQLGQYDLWLAMYGSQPAATSTQHCRASGGNKQRQLAPCCSWQLSDLPQRTSCVQVFLYDPTPRASSWLSVQKQQHLHQPTWLSRRPGTMTLASLLQMLQQAHSTIQQQQQGSLQQRQQALTHQPPGSACGSNEQLTGWQVLAPFLDWPCSSTSRSISRPRHCDTWLRCPARQSWRTRRHHKPAGAHGSGVSRADDAGYVDSIQSSRNDVLPGVLQHLLGLVLAVLLVAYRQQLLQFTTSMGNKLQHQLLQRHIDWLREAHPGGIKLHFETSYLLATAAEVVLQLSAAFYSAAWPLMGCVVLLLIAGTSALGGVVTALAVAADLLLVVLWPVEMVYVGCAASHRWQLRCLRATWRLLRGKQQVRRFSDRMQQQQQPNAAVSAAGHHVSSSDQVSVEQLIVGVLLFTPLLGLLPTTTAWYISICCLHAAVWVLRLLLAHLSELLRLQGLQVLVRRWSCPQQFPGQLMVQLLEVRDHNTGSTGQTAVAAGINHEVATRKTHSSTVQTQASASPGHIAEEILVAYYHVFCKPLSYYEVLRTKAVSGQTANNAMLGAEEGWVLGTVGLALAVMRGNSWGIGLLGHYSLQQPAV